MSLLETILYIWWAGAVIFGFIVYLVICTRQTEIEKNVEKSTGLKVNTPIWFIAFIAIMLLWPVFLLSILFRRKNN